MFYQFLIIIRLSWNNPSIISKLPSPHEAIVGGRQQNLILLISNIEDIQNHSPSQNLRLLFFDVQRTILFFFHNAGFYDFRFRDHMNIFLIELAVVGIHKSHDGRALLKHSESVQMIDIYNFWNGRRKFFCCVVFVGVHGLDWWLGVLLNFIRFWFYVI